MASRSDRKFFHESWYRIATEHLSLRSSVRVRRQYFRGERWYILHEPFSDQFFRLKPPAYNFVARLDPRRSVEEVWRETIENVPDSAPGQEEVIQLLAQLYHANLLHFDLPADSEMLFERYKERKQSVRHASMRSIMFFRIPIFDPNGILRRLSPLIRRVVSPVGAAIWIAAVAVAVAMLLGRLPDLFVQAQGLLSLSNLPLLYLALILVKTLHEFGHAIAVTRFGGSVHTMGVMFLIFNPLPYTDTTAAWSFRSKWQRVLVGAAGMGAELFVAAVAVFVWAATGPGTVHALAYNMMLVASVSTIVFNINPLMRFDGYYILSDLLDIPNLHTRSSGHLRHLVERYAFGFKKSTSPAATRSEGAWLTLFGITSGVYKLVIFSAILIVIADRFLLLGIIMAAVCAVAWVLTPLLRLVHYLASSPRLERTRFRAAAACLLAAGIAVALLGLVPFRSGFAAPGVLQASRNVIVVNDVAGMVEQLAVESGSDVRQGQLLLRLSNRDLDFQIEEIDARLREARALEERAFSGSPADLEAIRSTIASISKQLDRFRKELEELEVRAQHGGTWVAPSTREIRGTWLPRGTRIGQIIDESSFYFASVVSEQNASSIFSDAIRKSEVRLVDDPEQPIPVTAMTRIPVETTKLPSSALGFQGGGAVATSTTASGGSVATQPFFELRLAVSERDDGRLYQGLSGEVRFELNPEPLLEQAYRKLRQLIQSRYQI